jgi:hypothetical protein
VRERVAEGGKGTRSELNSKWTVLLLGVLIGSLASPAGAAAQHPQHEDAPARRLHAAWGAQALGMLARVAPAMLGETYTEAYLTQPAVMGHLALGDRLLLEGVLNFEGLTLRRGELNPGIWGEGYVDRRHPHTFLHEVMTTVRLAGGPEAPRHLTATFGKGFAPFGTDDPMARPLVRYPANHHLAQILERLVGVVAYREGPLVLEAALFNGDEPARPRDFANVRRFGDSWAARATLLPLPGLEAAASFAALESPEFPAGSGFDHRKWAASVRAERTGAPGDRRYALIEWARTDEYGGGQRAFTFHTALAEAAASRGATEAAIRLERTVRPEEERLLDLFRSPRPHGDAHILGRTRWASASARISHGFGGPGTLRLAPFLEFSVHDARALDSPAVLAPQDLYGSNRLRSVSAGVRIDAGHPHARMGRYGAARASVQPYPPPTPYVTEPPEAAPPHPHHR